MKEDESYRNKLIAYMVPVPMAPDNFRGGRLAVVL
jgi:hypothetical protein